MAADHDQAVERVGERLRRLRLERGLSQRDLLSPGVSYAYISRIEAGTRPEVFERAANVASNLQGEPSTAEREL